jgi:hypothetical protein
VKQKIAGRDGGFSVLSEIRAEKIGVGQGHVEVKPAMLIELAASLSSAQNGKTRRRKPRNMAGTKAQHKKS